MRFLRALSLGVVEPIARLALVAFGLIDRLSGARLVAFGRRERERSRLRCLACGPSRPARGLPCLVDGLEGRLRRSLDLVGGFFG